MPVCPITIGADATPSYVLHNKYARGTPFMHRDHLRRVGVLWGGAGEYAITEFDRLNQKVFNSEPPGIRRCPDGIALGPSAASTPRAERGPKSLQMPRDAKYRHDTRCSQLS
jgi:hypothetical protein